MTVDATANCWGVERSKPGGRCRSLAGGAESVDDDVAFVRRPAEVVKRGVPHDVVAQEEPAGAKVRPGGHVLEGHVLVGMQAVMHENIEGVVFPAEAGQEFPGVSQFQAMSRA